MVRIRIDDADGASVRIEVSTGRGSSLDLNVGSSGGTMFIGDGAGSRSFRIASKARGRRKFRNRVGGKPVSPAMEAAAVETFLAGADVTRLGRSLADV